MSAFRDGMAGVLGLHGYVQQGFRDGEERKQRNTLAQLTGDYYAAPSQNGLAAIARAGGDPSQSANYGMKMEDREQAEIGQMAAVLANADPARRPEIYAQMQGRIQPFAQKRGLPLPSVWNESILPEVQQIAQLWGGGPQSQMPAEVRTALFFKQHPELAAAEAERYKNRPFYDSNTGQLIYPKPPGGGGSGGGMPQGRELPAQLASTAQFMLEQGVPEAKIDAWLSQQTGQPFQAAPAGPTVVQAGPSAGARAYDSASAKARAEYDGDRQRAQFDVQQSAAVESAKSAAGVEGEATGKARVNLPNAMAQAQDMLSVIQKAKTHPGLKTATGLAGTIDPRNRVPGTDATNFIALSDQIKGKAFLEAYNSLRGSGAITEQEGQAATNAIARLNRAQSTEAYLVAIGELEQITQRGVDRMRARAGAATPRDGGGKYRVGQIIEHGGKKYRVTGGDMNDPDVEEVQ
jgi:hypothetical protein